MDIEKPLTRIQKKNRATILEAALDVFSQFGFHGTTLDQIAKASGLSKPNLLYYFPTKEQIHQTLLLSLMTGWEAPLDELTEESDPIEGLLNYARVKLLMSRDHPRESRLFANEIIGGAPNLRAILANSTKATFDEKAKLVERWIQDGRIAPVDPYQLFFTIWGMTQHYADFEAQIDILMKGKKVDVIAEAEKLQRRMLLALLTPEPENSPG